MRVRADAIRTKVAIAVLVLAVAGCGSSGLSEKDHRDFVGGCTNSSAPRAACECIYTQLTTKQGVNSDAKLKSLYNQLQAAVRSGNLVAGLPSQMRNAILTCRSSFGR